MFASIIVDISIESLDRPFTYHVPDRLLERVSPGTKVSVPFGRGNRVITGYILELMDRARFDADKIKDIIDVVVEQSASEGLVMTEEREPLQRACHPGRVVMEKE